MKLLSIDKLLRALYPLKNIEGTEPADRDRYFPLGEPLEVPTPTVTPLVTQ